MRIGLIVDGEAEYRSLGSLLARVETPHELVGVLAADLQPYASAAQIVKSMKARVAILAKRRADLIVALIDMETRDECPGVWAAQIAQAMRAGCVGSGVHNFDAVVKTTCYENWLLSDTSALEKMPRRFKLSRSDINRISPNKADGTNAQAILKASVIGSAYDKVEDAKRIMALSDPLHMAANSRSFRRLLRVLEHPRYLTQSRRP